MGKDGDVEFRRKQQKIAFEPRITPVWAGGGAVRDLEWCWMEQSDAIVPAGATSPHAESLPVTDSGLLSYLTWCTGVRCVIEACPSCRAWPFARIFVEQRVS